MLRIRGMIASLCTYVNPKELISVALPSIHIYIGVHTYTQNTYLKVTIIYRYIFLRFWLKTPFASTKFCDLYAEMVQGQQILIFYTITVHIANDYGYKILRFWANPQKYQTVVPAKNSHLKVHF